MKSKIFILACIVAMPFAANAQLKGVMQKAKYKVNQRVDSKVDKAMDDALDKAEGKPTNDVATAPAAPASQPAAQPAQTQPAPEAASVKSFSKYDFVAGEKVSYYNNFETDAEGELPTGWNTNGSGEVVTLSTLEGKWLRMHKAFTYLTDNTKQLPENYTMEFDVVMQLKNNGWMFPELRFGMLAYNNDTTNLNILSSKNLLHGFRMLGSY